MNEVHRELSGAAWVARFPTSASTEDLATPFRENVNRFIAALQAAHATVAIAATFRPPERAYLMHYAYQIARNRMNPETVPLRVGVNINWVHKHPNGEVNLQASREAAQAMVDGYGIAYAPALESRHTQRRAIDMSISWSETLEIYNASNTLVSIRSAPRTGQNTALHTVGSSYSVIKLVNDPPHWSDDGH